MSSKTLTARQTDAVSTAYTKRIELAREQAKRQLDDLREALALIEITIDDHMRSASLLASAMRNIGSLVAELNTLATAHEVLAVLDELLLDEAG